MARPGISFDEVAAAADALVGRGERPTIQAIRAEIGTGSPNTIHRHLQAWRSAQAPAKREAARLPDELAAALAEEIERQAARARADAEDRAIEAQQTADALAETGEQLEAQTDELTNQVETLTGERDQVAEERDRLTEERDRLAAELERERTALEREREQLAEARNRIATLTEQREQLQADVTEAQAAAKAATAAQIQAEKEAAVMAARLEAEQAVTADLRQRLAADAERSGQRIAELERYLEQERNVSDKSNQLIAGLTEELAAERAEIKDLRDRLEHQGRELDTCDDELKDAQRENVQLRTEIGRLQQQLQK
jgi:chromosome segregation ATPase